MPAETEEIAMVTVGLLVTLKAKPGKEDELTSFLAGALPLAQAEPETTAWFAIKIDASTLGIVDVFPDAGGGAPGASGRPDRRCADAAGG
jgi:hypothetical protein